VLDLPEFTAHFYVVIGIEEDLEIAAIRGFLRYDQLVNYQSELQPEVDWNYHLPLAWFNREPNELLLYLQCLAPTAIPLPEIPTHRQASLRRMQTPLLNLLPQLHSRPLWQVLTWEQATAVLTSLNYLTGCTTCRYKTRNCPFSIPIYPICYRFNSTSGERQKLVTKSNG
jgi:hypothetical protein